MAELVDLEQAPHRVALATSSLEALAKGAPDLLRLLENLRPREVDPRHRRLRFGNAALQQRVFRPLPGALDLLRALGYVPAEEEGETVLCLDVARHDPGAVEQEVSWLQRLIERRWQPPPWPCPACTLQNDAGAAACVVCGGPRPLWAAPSTVPRPRLHAQAPPRSSGVCAEEQRRRAEGLQCARSERQRERERILAEARADRQRFEDVGAGGQAVSAPAVAAEPAPAVAAEPAVPQAVRQPSSATLRIRLPDGAVFEETFKAEASLSTVFRSVDGLLAARGEPAEDYSLLQAIPRRVFLREVLGGRPLAALGLAPSSTLSVLRGEDRGRVQSGGVETALLTGDIEGLSYEELQELEARMGDVVGKRARRASSRTREACTRVHTYQGGAAAAAGSAGGERRCAICLVDFEAGAALRTLWCGHGFHRACVDRWLAEKDECPVCRVAIQASQSD